MAIGIAVMLFWAHVPIQPKFLGTALYLLGTLLTSFGAAYFLACLCRVNGEIGPGATLELNVAGVLAATCLFALFSILPNVVCQLFLFIVPIAFVGFSRGMFIGHPR